MNRPFVLVVEQVVAEPTQYFLTGTLRSRRVGIQEVRSKLDEQTWPIRNALSEHLDAEVVGLEDEPIPAA